MAVVGRWSPCLKTKPMQEDAKRKRLLAAAAAYVAVHFRGRLLVVLKEDAVSDSRPQDAGLGSRSVDFNGRWRC